MYQTTAKYVKFRLNKRIRSSKLEVFRRGAGRVGVEGDDGARQRVVYELVEEGGVSPEERIYIVLGHDQARHVQQARQLA